MDIENLDISIKKVFEFLDTIDLMPYINSFKHKEIYDLMKDLEKIFPYKDEYSVSLFDAIAEDEFIAYLDNKYDIVISEETVTHYYIR